MIVVYIHGFRTSANAVKAGITRDFLSLTCPEVGFISPEYPDDLTKSYESLCTFTEETLKKDDEVCLSGSSMGGFLSLLLSIRYDLKTALINPCIYPAAWIVENGLEGAVLENYDTGNSFVIDDSVLSYVRKLEERLKEYRRDKTAVFLQSGDEVLDYRKSLEFFSDITCDVTEGGCHGYENFDKKLPEIMEFFSKKS